MANDESLLSFDSCLKNAIMETTINYPNGDFYEGEVDEQGLHHGTGVMNYKKRQYENWAETQASYKRYSGQWNHGVKSGKGKMEYYMNGNGVMEYFGNWENDFPNGKGNLTKHSSVTNMTYSGEWKDGLRHGFGKYTLNWDKGTFPPEKYEGEWKDDKRCGKGKCFYGRKEENVYEGDWLNDMRDGHGVWKYENGDVVECEWKQGSKNGKGTFTFADGGIIQAEWVDGNMQMDSVKKTDFSLPLLLLKVHKSGFDYNNSATCMMKAKVGEYLMIGNELVEKDKQNLIYPPEPIITINTVDAEKVEYVVSSEFVEGKSPVSDVIAAGEKKEYSYSIETTNTIYDEDYDYTIERVLEIECK